MNNALIEAETAHVLLWEVCFVIVVLAFALLIGCLFAIIAAPIGLIAYAMHRVRQWLAGTS